MRWFCLLLLMVFITGCSSNISSEALSKREPNLTNVNFEAVFDGECYAKKYLFKNNNEWQNFTEENGLLAKYRRIRRFTEPYPSLEELEKLQLPDIDFEKEMVIATYYSSKMGSETQITDIKENPKNIIVTVVRNETGSYKQGLGMSTPCHIVKLRKSDKNISFNIISIGFDSLV